VSIVLTPPTFVFFKPQKGDLCWEVGVRAESWIDQTNSVRVRYSFKDEETFGLTWDGDAVLGPWGGRANWASCGGGFGGKKKPDWTFLWSLLSGAGGLLDWEGLSTRQGCDLGGAFRSEGGRLNQDPIVRSPGEVGYILLGEVLLGEATWAGGGGGVNGSLVGPKQKKNRNGRFSKPSRVQGRLRNHMQKEGD